MRRALVCHCCRSSACVQRVGADSRRAPAAAILPGRPASRSLKPYTGAPEDLRPFSKYTTPYYEFYQDLVEYNGAARDVPDAGLKDLSEIRIGFVGATL